MSAELGLQEIRERLLQENEEFKRLAQKHSEYAQELERLVHKPYLTDSEQLEETRLKKMKLRLKDQMEMLIQKYRLAHTQN